MILLHVFMKHLESFTKCIYMPMILLFLKHLAGIMYIVYLLCNIPNP